MRFARTFAALLAALACGCAAKKSHAPPADLAIADDLAPAKDLSVPPPDLLFANVDFSTPPAPGPNVAELIVDSGPNQNSYNIPYVSITLCAPGTTTCQTIDHILVDTGSTGLRMIGSTINGSILAQLPMQTDTFGNPLSECYHYVETYVYGSVRTATLMIGGETSESMNFQVIGDLSQVPSDCASFGMATQTVEEFGAKGIIGVGTGNPDCGTNCLTTATQESPEYYSCPSGQNCTTVGVPLANQIPNPVATFATDNNGVLVQLPAISASGEANVTGSLVFGIGTQANNAIVSETVLMTDENSLITTTFQGTAYSSSFFDSGSTDLYFHDPSIPACANPESAWLCPGSTVNLMAVPSGTNGTSTQVNFTVADFTSLYNGTSTAFDDSAEPAFQYGGSAVFDWGLASFYGHRVFTAINGAVTPYGTGPFFAL